MSKTMSEMLEKVQNDKTVVTIITANGYQMNGVVIKHDSDCIVFKNARAAATQIVCIGNISTITIPDRTNANVKKS